MTELLFRDDAYLTRRRLPGDRPHARGRHPASTGRCSTRPGAASPATAACSTGGAAGCPSPRRSRSRAGMSRWSRPSRCRCRPSAPPSRQVLDWDRRHRHMRVHTALHLLSVVIPLPVTGGQIGADRGRLDFDMPDPPGDVAALEEALNSLIERDLPVTDDWITDDELAGQSRPGQDHVGAPADGAGPGAAGADRRRGRPDRPATLRRHPCRAAPPRSAGSRSARSRRRAARTAASSITLLPEPCRRISRNVARYPLDQPRKAGSYAARRRTVGRVVEGARLESV